MRRAVLLALLVAAAALGAPSAPPAPVPAHFSHAAHADRGVDVTQCAACHAVDAAGTVAPPAATGHQPCLSANCHARDFVAAGPTTRAKDPTAYAKAVGFCLGCHDTKDGAAPSPAERQVAGAALRSYQLEAEYHVEMQHDAHAQRTACRTCHAVDATTFALVPDAPGHAQCVLCHNPKKQPDFTMANCAYCHAHPGRAEFFFPPGKPRRKLPDVTACDGERYATLVARFKGDGKRVACFRHERKEHRFTADGKPVQCAACHATVAAEHSLADVLGNPVIPTSESEHEQCGNSAACHARDFANTQGGKRCLMCHGDHSNNLFQ